MNTARHTAVHEGRFEATPEQLTLLARAEVPLQFRLDERTRRRGLAQIALIRQQFATMTGRPTSDAAAHAAADAPAADDTRRSAA